MKNQLVDLSAGLAALTASALLAGCGLAETGAAATTHAAASAEEIKQGKELEEKVKRDIAAAQQAEADSRAKMEEASQ
jgi:hypothetical protein